MAHGAQWLSLALRVLTLWTLLLSARAAADSSIAQRAFTTAGGTESEFVRVILLGATGNLAAKYLWVASFRLALQSYEQRSAPQFEFIAAATNSQAYGEQWKARFFDAKFFQRVCGDNNSSSSGSSSTHSRCTEFFYERFLPSVQYAQLRDEAHYEQLVETLTQQDAVTPADAATQEATISRVEVGRLVYLAIPPTFFAQSSELAHKYLRPKTTPIKRPFFRVVVEKPFGTDLASAQALQTQLHKSLKDHEIFLIDHFAGKAAVQALSEFFERNHKQLRPQWSSRHITKIEVRMTETETCEGRIQYFHSAGIICDVIANHLQLLLGLAVAPSFEHLAHADHERLAFAQSLSRAEAESNMLLLGRYEDYALHYEQETGDALSELSSSLFVPTAALVTLQSSASNWNDTRFVLSAVKAAHERRLELLIQFKTPSQENEDDTINGGCELRVTIQTKKNAERRTSERIEWTCAFLDGSIPPSGWEVDKQSSQRVMVPSSPLSSQSEMWQLGDERTAYDMLLREAATGNRRHFASMQEAVASWELWTPIVQHAERASLRTSSPSPETALSQLQGSQASYTIYPTGSASWSSAQATTVVTDTPSRHSVRDEL